MGFTPQQVNEMSMWQYFAALNGYIDANTPKEGNKLTDSQADDLFDWIEQGGTEAEQLSTQTYWLDGGRLVPAGVVRFRPQ
jgi:hypothetical protein